MRYLKILVCLLLVLALVGCGKDAGNDTTGDKNSGNKPEDAPETITTAPAEDAPVPGDMWFNAEGQYGTVAYNYNANGVLEETIFYYHSGKIWRRIEHGTYWQYDGAPVDQTQSIYNGNGNLLFSLTYSMQDRSVGEGQIPKSWQGYDHFLETASSTVYYTPYGIAETHTYNNTCKGAQDYYVISWKSAECMDTITHFLRDGTQSGTYVMYYEADTLAYIGVCDAYTQAPSKFYAVEYDASGRISSLLYGSATLDSNSGTVRNFNAKDENAKVFLTYDQAGHLIGIDDQSQNYRTLWDFFYEDNQLVATQYRYDRASYSLENFARGYYTYHADGMLLTADYGYLVGSLGSGDTSYYTFEYHENGMIASIRGYWESAYNAGSDDLDLEWEYFFDVTGYKSMHRLYKKDYYNNPVYYEYTYDASGNKIGSVSGSYTEDGTLIPG